MGEKIIKKNILFIVGIIFLIISVKPISSFLLDKLTYSYINSRYEIYSLLDKSWDNPDNTTEFNGKKMSLNIENVEHEWEIKDFEKAPFVKKGYGDIVLYIDDREIHRVQHKPISLHKKNGGIEPILSFQNADIAKVSYGVENENFAAITLNTTEETIERFKPIENQTWISYYVFENEVKEKTFNYNNRTKLETRLAQEATPMSFGYYNNIHVFYLFLAWLSLTFGLVLIYIAWRIKK